MIRKNLNIVRRVNVNETLKTVLCLALVLILLPGCTTLRPLDSDPQAVQRSVKEGSQVRIMTAEGRKVAMVVEGIDEHRIAGQGKEVLLEDIAELKVREFSPEKTAAMILIIVGLLALYIVAAVGAAQASLLSGG